MSELLLEAIVVYLNERVTDMRRLVNIISAEAKKKERTKQDIRVIDILHSHILRNVVVGLYPSPRKVRSITPRGARGKD